MYRIAGYAVMAAARCSLPLANAATVTLSPTNDVVASAYQPDTNSGGNAVLATNLSSYSQKQFTYMMFDLSTIPAGETIVGAR